MSQSMDKNDTKQVLSKAALSPRSECFETDSSMPLMNMPSTTRNADKKDPKFYYDY